MLNHSAASHYVICRWRRLIVSSAVNVGDHLRPSEVVRTLTMRLRNLETALARASHHMQVVFIVNGVVEKSIVEQILSTSSKITCKERTSAPDHETHIFTVQNKGY